MWRVFQYLWAGPNTVAGLLFALLARATGGTWQVRDGVVEAAGGALGSMMRRLPTSGTWRQPAGAAALTLGHVVLAVDQAALDRTRIHERVHVRQYERWGPLFLPAYLIASMFAKLRGNHGYLGNSFEREAYTVSHPERFADHHG